MTNHRNAVRVAKIACDGYTCNSNEALRRLEAYAKIALHHNIVLWAQTADAQELDAFHALWRVRRSRSEVLTGLRREIAQRQEGVKAGLSRIRELEDEIRERRELIACLKQIETQGEPYGSRE